MIIKNWMLPQQFSITSDALAVEAVMLIREHNLKMLPVVDNNRLRGVVHRRDLSEAAQCVTGSGDACEMNYFCNKLKVKDIMVRMPITINVNDSVEETLTKGRDLMMSTFPVMDGEQVVGVVSDREIFVTLFKLLEAGKRHTRITLTGVNLEGGTLSKILEVVDRCKCTARAIFTVSDKDNGEVRVVLRADCEDPAALRKSLEDQGYRVMEFVN
ncbi:MAG: CBS domain-containing protein [Pseudomonadota bacterium]